MNIYTNAKYFLSPFFLSKHYLLKDLKKIIKKYNFSGNLFDFGCGSKPYKQLFGNLSSYKGIDFHSFSENNGFKKEKPDFYFSDTYLSDFILDLPDVSFDVVTAFQVLEHHKKPNLMISEIYRITKKGGHILITAPFLGGIHEDPYDYQRYTKYGLMELFSSYDCQIIEILEQGSLFSTITMLINEYINSLVSKGGFSLIVGLIMYAPMFIFQYCSLILDKIFKTNKICFNYLLLVEKRN